MSSYEELLDEIGKELEDLDEEVDGQPGPLAEPQRSDALSRLPPIYTKSREAADLLGYDGAANLDNLPVNAAACVIDMALSLAIAGDPQEPQMQRGMHLLRMSFEARADGLMQTFIELGPENELQSG